MHTIFQNQGIAPGVVMGLRGPDDSIPAGERSFLLASTKKALEDGDVPVKIKNFKSEKDKNK